MKLSKILVLLIIFLTFIQLIWSNIVKGPTKKKEDEQKLHNNIKELKKISYIFNISNPICERHKHITSKNENIYWKTAKLKDSGRKFYVMKSEPICLDEDKIPVHRTCVRGDAHPLLPPDCASTQTPLHDTLHLCPEPFKALPTGLPNGYICLLVSEAKKWEKDCFQWGVSESLLHLDNAEFEAVQKFLKENEEMKKEKKFWLPLRSFGRFNPFLWQLPGGDSFGNVFDEDELREWNVEGQRRSGGNCLALSREGNFRRIYIEDCSEEYPSVCIYNAKKHYLKLACPGESVTMRLHGEYHQCLEITESSTDCECFFQVNTLNKNTFYRQAFHDIFESSAHIHYNFIHKTSLVKPKPDNYLCLSSIPGFDSNDYIWDYEKWLDVENETQETFWNFYMHTYERNEPDNENSYTSYTVLDSRGQWVTFNNYNCKACVSVVKIITPEIYVVFHQERQALELIVYSEEFLWRRDEDDSGVTCFTDAGGNTLLTNVRKDLIWKDKIKTTDIIGQSNNFIREYITKSIYQLEFEYSTPGHYWCEGLSLPDFKEVKSRQVVAYEEYDGTVYSFRATMNCNKCERGFTKKELKELSKNFKSFLKKFDSHEKLFGDAKVMQIKNIPQDSTKLEVIFHVVVEYNDFSFNCPQNITHHICTLYGIQRDLEIITRNASHSEKHDQFKNITVRHTAFCLPYRSSQTNEDYWMSAEIGERSVLQNLCLTTNLLPVYRICKGDFIIGAQWDEDHVPICHEMEIPNLTQKLFELDNSNKNSSTIIDEMQEIVEVDSREIIPADLYIVGTLLRKCAMEASNIIEFGLKEVGKILSILSHIMEVNETTARASQVLNSTNVLMDMNEKIITSVLLDASISNKTLPGNETNDLGVIEIKAKNIIVFTINPFVANVTGIALYRSSNQSNDIEDLIPRYLYANQDATELLMDNEELEVATFVPEDLLQRINEINQTASGNVTLAPKPPLRIVIMVKANDRLYQENRNVSYFRANGRVVSVTIPGYGPNLPSLLPLIFHTLYEITNETNACGFWDFTPTNKNGTSQWATRGCEFLLSSPNLDPPLVLCGCSHLTDFASLVMGAYKNDIPLNKLSIHKNHLIALDVITTVGCSLSIVGIWGIWITAIFFKSWRQRTGSKVLLQLSAAIALQMFLFLFINAEYVLKDYLNVNQKIICITLGALLQYSVLVVFSWMLIIAYLQYLRYVVVFGNRKPAHFTIKSIIVGWIMPTVPVFLVIGLDMTSYLPPKKDFHGFCYPQGNSLYLGILLPIALILVANLGLYIAVIYSITRKMDGRKNSRKKKQRIQKAQLRLSVFLFFLLGMTWVFGFLIYTHRSPYIIFEYLFCLTATIQGFVVFVYFVILDPATRNLWENFFYMLCCRRSKNRNYYLQ